MLAGAGGMGGLGAAPGAVRIAIAACIGPTCS